MEWTYSFVVLGVKDEDKCDGQQGNVTSVRFESSSPTFYFSKTGTNVASLANNAELGLDNSEDCI